MGPTNTERIVGHNLASYFIASYVAAYITAKMSELLLNTDYLFSKCRAYYVKM
jgi:hypothetical protein